MYTDGDENTPGAGVELPQQLAGLGVEGEEVAGDVAAAADEDDAAGGDDRARPVRSLRTICCHTSSPVVGSKAEKYPFARTSGIQRAVDGVHVEQPGPRAVGERAVVRAAAACRAR